MVARLVPVATVLLALSAAPSYSSNPDPARRRRRIEIKVTRPSLEVRHRGEYVLLPRGR